MDSQTRRASWGDFAVGDFAPAASADDPARTLTMDYVLRIAPPPPPVNPDPTPVEPIASRAAFVEAIEEGDFDWFSAETA